MEDTYKVGEKVIHPTYGECVIKRIEKLLANKKMVDYYQIVSVSDSSHKIYIPVNEHDIKLKRK